MSRFDTDISNKTGDVLINRSFYMLRDIKSSMERIWGTEFISRYHEKFTFVAYTTTPFKSTVCWRKKTLAFSSGTTSITETISEFVAASSSLRRQQYHSSP